MTAPRRIFKYVGITVLSTMLFLLLMVIAVYLPPVQRRLVDYISATMEKKTGMHVRIDAVRLTPFLNLDLRGVTALDQTGDTLLAVRGMHLDIAFWPLWKGRADIESFDLQTAHLNTKSLIADVCLRGNVGRFSAAAHGVEWQRGRVLADHVVLADASLDVSLSDTAAKDTSGHAVLWAIDVAQAQVRNSTVRVNLPGDSVHISATLGQALLRQGHFDLGQPRYAIELLELQQSALTMNSSRRPLPSDALFRLEQVGLRLTQFNYDKEKRLHCRLEHFHLRETTHQLTLSELCGDIRLDTVKLELPAVRIATPYSQFTARCTADFSAFRPAGQGYFSVSLQGALGNGDLVRAIPSFLPRQTAETTLRLVDQLIGRDNTSLTARLQGNLRQFTLQEATIAIPGLLRLKTDGYVRHADEARRSGHLNFSLSSTSSARLRPFLPADIRQTVQIPDGLSALGTIDFASSIYGTHFTLSRGNGRLTANAAIDLDTKKYRLGADIVRFPLAHFVKNIPISPLSANLTAEGKGFDPASLASHLRAAAHIRQLQYDRYPLGGIQLSGKMYRGNAEVDFRAHNPMISGMGRITALLHRRYAAQINIRLERIDLQRITGMKDTLTLGGDFHGTLEATQNLRHFAAKGQMGHLRFVAPTRQTLAQDIYLDIASHPDTTHAHLSSGDLTLDFSAQGGQQHLQQQFTKVAKLALRQFEKRDINPEALKQLLPNMALRLHAGTDNLLARYLRYKQYGINSLSLQLNANARDGVNGHASIGKLENGALLIDTIYSDIRQTGNDLQLEAVVINHAKTNPNPFTAQLHGSLLPAGIKADVAFMDASGDLGLRMGAQVEMEKGGLLVHLEPDTAIVAYRKFVINTDNHLSWSDDRRIRADIRLQADDGTGLQIYSEGGDSLQNDVTVSIHQLNLRELANVLPYLPPIGGTLDGDFHLTENKNIITAVGTMAAHDFSYQGMPIGTLGAELMYQPRTDGQHFANAFISYNGREVATCGGTYDSRGKGTFNGTLSLNSLPLSIANAFLSDTHFGLKGNANGELKMQGSLTAPDINGNVTLNEAHLYSNVYGTDFTLDGRTVEIKNSLLSLDKFRLTTSDNVPITLDGDINLSQLTRPYLNIDIVGHNFPVVNAKRKSESLLYGKLLTNIVANVHGSPEHLIARGKLTVLDNTDVTYLLNNTPLSSESDLSDLVTFTNFADTVATAVPDETAQSSNLDAAIDIVVNPGARFHCFLTPNGESYVDVSGDGNLTFRMQPQGEMRLTGKLTITEGKMNYQLPVIPLRTFHFVSGSYVEFTGNMMNPTLNITATERVKTIVTEDERQRAVTFDAGVKISRTLENMGLEFIIDAPEDLTIKNQLTAMSTEDRGKAAVALLATGMYITDDNLSTGGIKASNALNAFLQSEIQNIAGKALSTIDLSFGMENGVSTSGNTTTDYSFQFSKRFLNNRMRVVVGGKVSSGADADEATQSLIDNIALEYRLDTGGARYVRIFYDRNSHDPLEGTLMKTGVGLVMQRRTDRLGDLFLFRRKKKSKTDTSSTPIQK